MTVHDNIVARCRNDRGRDTYSQARRYRIGYSDCSSYAQRIYREIAGIDIGSYTTAIALNPAGRVVTESVLALAAGVDMQTADVVLWGWRTDHRPGYPYSHVGIYDAYNRGTWDQYGDIPPHNGPNFHTLEAWASRADRIRVLRFLPDLPDILPATRPAPTPLVVDGIFGPRTIAELQKLLGVTPDGTMGPRTKRALQSWLGVACDGIIGPVTIRALQRRIGANIDGEWGRQTTSKLQRYLNDRIVWGNEV